MKSLVGIRKSKITVSSKYSVELTIEAPREGVVSTMTAEWSPKMPTKMTQIMLDKYRAGRNQLWHDIAEELGMEVFFVSGQPDFIGLREPK